LVFDTVTLKLQLRDQILLLVGSAKHNMLVLQNNSQLRKKAKFWWMHFSMFMGSVLTIVCHLSLILI